jgi:hypothetical protein
MEAHPFGQGIEEEVGVHPQEEERTCGTND